jgi:hypothetical protein
VVQAVEEMRAEISANREQIALLQARSLVRQSSRSSPPSGHDAAAVAAIGLAYSDVKRATRRDDSDGPTQPRPPRRASIAAIPHVAGARPLSANAASSRGPHGHGGERQAGDTHRPLGKPTVSVAPAVLGPSRPGVMSAPSRPALQRASSAAAASVSFKAGRGVLPGPPNPTGALPSLAVGALQRSASAAVSQASGPSSVTRLGRPTITTPFGVPQSTGMHGAGPVGGAGGDVAIDDRCSALGSDSGLSVRFSDRDSGAPQSDRGPANIPVTFSLSDAQHSAAAAGRSNAASRAPEGMARLLKNRRASTGDLMRGLMPDAPVHDASVLGY